VAWFEELARPLPVRYRARVVAIERPSNGDCYAVEIEGGERIKARNVVVATRLYQTPKIPALSCDFPPHIKQLSTTHHCPYPGPLTMPRVQTDETHKFVTQ
jgi:putative flavoprotein involved in K+ transport